MSTTKFRIRGLPSTSGVTSPGTAALRPALRPSIPAVSGPGLALLGGLLAAAGALALARRG